MKANVIAEFFINYWYVIVGLIVLVIVGFWYAYRFLGMPTEKQKEKVMEWLKWACVEAEKKLQSDTGKLKLREVYDKFCAVPAFKWVAIVISFKQFEKWVSDALIEAKKMLAGNPSLAKYVYGENAEAEVEKIKKQLGAADNE